ncbi:MAG: RBBP9/YdeN family alpha/beta hydrolase [Elusimicrobiota bacterium]
MGNKKVILIHGYTSSPKKEKYQLIAEKLADLEMEYSIPELPGGEHPRSKEWLKIINREVKNTEKPIVLVGHSLGTRAILLYLDKYEREVDTVILIASFDNNYEENRKEAEGKFKDFFDYPVDIEKVKKLADRFVVAHSKDDDAIDYNQGRRMAEELEAELKTYDNMGHFGGGKERAEENAKAFFELIKSAL